MDDMKIATGVSKFHERNDRVLTNRAYSAFGISIRSDDAMRAVPNPNSILTLWERRKRERSSPLSRTINSVTILIPSIRHDRTRVRRSPHAILMTRRGSNAL